jgi:hypothetical protein
MFKFLPGTGRWQAEGLTEGSGSQLSVSTVSPQLRPPPSLRSPSPFGGGIWGAALLLASPLPAFAQEHDHSQMDHGLHGPSAAKPKSERCKTEIVGADGNGDRREGD